MRSRACLSVIPSVCRRTSRMALARTRSSSLRKVSAMRGSAPSWKPCCCITSSAYWAQYAEEVMQQQGFHDGADPRMALTFRKEELRVLANAILDVRLHTLGMTDRQALDLMIKDTFQERPEAEGKLRRAKLSSTQLPTYFVGWQAWRRLRRDAEARADDASLNLSAFHDRVLSYGAVPMGALRRLVLEEDVASRAAPHGD